MAKGLQNFSLFFAHTYGSVLPSWDCGTSHFHCTGIFLTILCFPQYLSTEGILPKPGPFWYIRYYPREKSQPPGLGPTTRADWSQGSYNTSTDSFVSCLWGADHWPVGLHALGNVLLPGAYWQKRFCWNIHWRKKIVQGCLCKSHFTAAGPFHSGICCADGEGAMLRVALPWTPAT